MGLRHGPGSQHMMGYGNYGIFWIVITVVLLLIIFLLVYKLLQKNKHTPTEIETGNKALNILRERYAKGELTDAEFTQKKDLLDKNN